MALRKSKLFTLLALTIVFGLSAAELATADDDIDLAAFDLEDLMSMEVTSVSKKSERAFEAPAAAFVITSEDIRRSGLRTIPELLRMVPGVEVAQLTASSYAISVRGSNSTFASKLLVLIDGRSVYTPLFAGVFWDVRDTPLADIDRIEVIRGPGGTVWGANAVNGVINIVTKSAAETRGWHIETGVGDYERAGSGMVRYGHQVNDDIDVRFYLKQFDRERLKKGFNAKDGFDQIRTGFRMDADIGDDGEFTLQGDLYDGTSDGIISGERMPTETGGGNVLARYTHNFSEDHNASVQLYYDRTDRALKILRYELDTIDIELKHQIKPLDWLEFVWGGQYRYRHDDARSRNPDTTEVDDLQTLFDTIGAGTGDDLGTVRVLDFSDAERKMDLFSGFAQIEGRAWEDKIRLTVGTKLEDNDTSGFEVQPSARLAFVPNETMTFWASASRAVRTPSRANEDVTTISATEAGVPIRDAGNRSIESEDLMAYEGGFRLQPTDWLNLDVAGFYNDYDDLAVSSLDQTRAFDPDGPGAIPELRLIERSNQNDADGHAWGIEFFSRVQIPYEDEIVKKWWIDATYTYLDVDLDRDGGDPIEEQDGKDDADEYGKTEAHHRVGLRSHFDLIWNLEFDLAYYYVSEIKQVGAELEEVEDFHRLDLRTAWHPKENIEASFSVENLTDSGHLEWNTELFIPTTKIPRTFYWKLALDF